MLKGNRTERRGFQLSLLIWLQEEGGKEREPKFLSPDSQKTRTDVGILYPTTCSQRLVYFSHWNVIKLEQNHWNPGYSAALWQHRATRLPSDIHSHYVRSSDRWDFSPIHSKTTCRLKTPFRNETLIFSDKNGSWSQVSHTWERL